MSKQIRFENNVINVRIDHCTNAKLLAVHHEDGKIQAIEVCRYPTKDWAFELLSVNDILFPKIELFNKDTLAKFDETTKEGREAKECYLATIKNMRKDARFLIIEDD